MFLPRVLALTSVLLCLGAPTTLGQSLPLPTEVEAPLLLAQRRPAGGILKELNLSQSQIQRMQAIRNQYKSQIAQKREVLQQAQRELRGLMAGTASKGQVLDKFRQVESLRQQLTEIQFNSMLDIRDILTPEQRRKFAEIMQNRRDNRSDF
ncbi:hypothetical protein BST81_15230 [Leptolyngbya sp. 'hensonii']|uniref:Spy/CpxP family protein refolding chaperone n=1 Tax=Leptolyngbya sp. 'hensonii' TaxID=1922337 RepID=UPI000950223A|nr:Spy/CpxP family protein refolding chaperone [Leptolyngbya sp. 'hensonii']OLP17670.1 hypothetical protein BST81_15230 [Leptolyngbya sp. 'hensonii']